MNRFALTLFVLLFTFVGMSLLQGCGDSGTARAAGTYELDNEAARASMQAEIDKIEDPMEKMGASAMLQMFDTMKMTFVLNADGTVEATTTVAGMGAADTARGTWTMKGKSINFTMKETGEGDPEKLTGTWRGETIELESPDKERMPFNLIFKRKAA